MSEAKVVILGSGGVGKSALCIQFTQGKYIEKYDPTIEDSYRKQVDVDGVARMLDILDTAGQEEYTAMRSQYMRSGQGFIIVYAVDDPESFEECETIWEQIQRAKDGDKVPCVLVGNKCDLPKEVQTQMAAEKAREWGVEFLETSAKERINVDQMFETLVRKINEYSGDVVVQPAAAAPAPAAGSGHAAPAAEPAQPPQVVKKPKKKGGCNIL